MKNTVFITGASSGLGRATARLFQQNGWNVVAGMRSPEKETELQLLENVLPVTLDVTNPDQIEQAIREAEQRFGTIHALVNSAGYGLMGVFEAANDQQIKDQFEVNVFGLMRMTKAVLPLMRKHRQGTIINISSFGGVTAGPFASLYNSSKFAVEGFSEALYFELLSLGIAVKIIEPGSIATNFRSGIDMIQNTIEDYSPELAAFVPKFTKRTAHLPKASAEMVAKAIWGAVADGSSRLRYAVGADAEFYIELKTKNTEEQFLKLMQQ